MSHDEKTARDLFAPAEPITTTRDRITATALDLFYERGFHAVGLDEVLRAVGVTKTTFYNHFDSKDALILAAVEMRDRWETRAFEQTAGELHDGTPRGAILAGFDVLDRWFRHREYGACLFINACAEFPSQLHPVHQAAAAHYARLSAVLIELCRQAGAGDEAQTLARELELLLVGAVTMRMVTGEDDTARRGRRAAALLLDARGA